MITMNKPDLDVVRLIETHSARCWPATFVDALHGWEIRRTPDVSSGRVNSVNAIAPERGKFDLVLETARTHFAKQDEWPLIRIQPLAGEEPVDRMKELGLHGEGETVVKVSKLTDGLASSSLSCVVSDAITPDWLSAYGDAHDTSVEEREAIARALSRVKAKQGFAVIYHEGRPVASGRGLSPMDGWVSFKFQLIPRCGGAVLARLLSVQFWGGGARPGLRTPIFRSRQKTTPLDGFTGISDLKRRIVIPIGGSQTTLS